MFFFKKLILKEKSADDTIAQKLTQHADVNQFKEIDENQIGPFHASK